MLGDSFLENPKDESRRFKRTFYHTISLKGLNCVKLYYGNDKQKEAAMF
jgi:hypothetical protein